jgi:hypothetical protein
MLKVLIQRVVDSNTDVIAPIRKAFRKTINQQALLFFFAITKPIDNTQNTSPPKASPNGNKQSLASPVFK